MRMAAERAEHEQVQAQARARMPLLPPVLRGFGGRLAHRVLHGVDVLFGHRALRALAAAMLVAQRRNRSPQNGMGGDNWSSQRSLLW